MSRKHLSKTSSSKLSPEKLETLKENARGILAECRRCLMDRQPFVGGVAMNLDIVPVRDKRIPTACTDGKSIYFDIDFLSNLSVDERLFVLAHEIWHNVMLHFVRCEGRDRTLFNIATDLEVNQLLVKDGLCIPKECLWPDKYGFKHDLNAEQYYELLLKQQNNSGSGSSGQSSPSAGGSSSSSGSGNSQSNSSNSENGGGESDAESKLTSAGKPKGQFDSHKYEGDDVENEAGENCSDKWGEVGFDEDFKPETSENEMRKSVAEIREAAVTAAQNYERQRGELPAHIKGIVQKLLKPEVSWKEVLAQFVTRASGEDRTWRLPNRRFVHSGLYLPSTEGMKMKIAVGIDTSGSVMQDLPKFLGELNALVKSFGNYELHLIQCDASVQDYKLYTEEDPLDLENEKFNVRGMGGTMLKPIFDYVELNELDVDAAVIFTDGYCEKFNEYDAPSYPVLWMVSKGGTKENLTFGEVHMFEKSED